MKSLYETILSSTNTGKHQKITVDYILAHGCEKKFSNGFTEYQHWTGNYFGYSKDDKLYYRMHDEKDRLVFKVVDTIGDYDLMVQYFIKKGQRANRKGLAALRNQIMTQLKTYKEG